MENNVLDQDPIFGKNKPLSMIDFQGNVLSVEDKVLFPAGKELMKGTIRKIIKNHFNHFEAYVENEHGFKKWKIGKALIKVEK